MNEQLNERIKVARRGLAKCSVKKTVGWNPCRRRRSTITCRKPRECKKKGWREFRNRQAHPLQRRVRNSIMHHAPCREEPCIPTSIPFNSHLHSVATCRRVHPYIHVGVMMYLKVRARATLYLHVQYRECMYNFFGTRRTTARAYPNASFCFLYPYSRHRSYVGIYEIQ